MEEGNTGVYIQAFGCGIAMEGSAIRSRMLTRSDRERYVSRVHACSPTIIGKGISGKGLFISQDISAIETAMNFCRRISSLASQTNVNSCKSAWVWTLNTFVASVGRSSSSTPPLRGTKRTSWTTTVTIISSTKWYGTTWRRVVPCMHSFSPLVDISKQVRRLLCNRHVIRLDKMTLSFVCATLRVAQTLLEELSLHFLPFSVHWSLFLE